MHYMCKHFKIYIVHTQYKLSLTYIKAQTVRVTIVQYEINKCVLFVELER